MKKIEQVGKKIVTQMTLDSRFGWPPECTGFLYQPERPAVDIPQHTEAENRMNKKKK